MEERKKVFFISKGKDIHTVKWINSLKEKYEIHLIYCKTHGNGINQIDKSVIIHELPFKPPFGYYLNALILKNLYKKYKPDIVNVHFASGYGTLARMAKLKNVILSVWGSDVYTFPNKSFAHKYIFIKNINYAKEICSTSNAMAKELKKKVPNLNKEIVITPFGVDIEKFKKVNNCNDSNINIGTVKKLEKKYGIIYSIYAVKRTIEKLKSSGETEVASKIRYYIYGEGKERKRLQKIIDQNGLGNIIFLKGEIPNEEVPKILNNIQIFCATSIDNSESFGVAVLEAIACEVPVIVSDVDGFKEIIENRKTGMIVQRKNIEEISNAIIELIHNKKLEEDIILKAKEVVKEKYSWKTSVEKMNKVYMNLLKTVN